MMDNKFMQEAIREAQKAAANGEVPVGAVLVQNNRILCCGHNLTESGQGILAHAELLVLQEGISRLKTRRLSGCSLYVTLEPCPMCAGAILLARPDRLFFGAYDPAAGACGGCYDLLRSAPIEVYGGIMEAECSGMLTDFFQKLR